MQNSGLVLTILTAILTAYVAFRHQQRLKAFELFYARRNEVIKDIEAAINTIVNVQTDHADDRPRNTFNARCFRDGLVLHHKIKGANFGVVADAMGSTYYFILEEMLHQGFKKESDWNNWLDRQLNCLSLLHGLAHRQMSKEMSFLTRSRFEDFFSKIHELTNEDMEKVRPQLPVSEPRSSDR